jgi:hypothetical protein
MSYGIDAAFVIVWQAFRERLVVGPPVRATPYRLLFADGIRIEMGSFKLMHL